MGPVIVSNWSPCVRLHVLCVHALCVCMCSFARMNVRSCVLKHEVLDVTRDSNYSPLIAHVDRLSQQSCLSLSSQTPLFDAQVPTYALQGA
jgi:hypothetical protein